MERCDQHAPKHEHYHDAQTTQERGGGHETHQTNCCNAIHPRQGTSKPRSAHRRFHSLADGPNARVLQVHCPDRQRLNQGRTLHVAARVLGHDAVARLRSRPQLRLPIAVKVHHGPVRCAASALRRALAKVVIVLLLSGLTALGSTAGEGVPAWCTGSGAVRVQGIPLASCSHHAGMICALALSVHAICIDGQTARPRLACPSSP